MLVKMNSEFKICPNCFEKNDIKEKFCKNCGFNLNGEKIEDFDINIFYNVDDLIDDAVLMYEGEDFETSLQLIDTYLEYNANNSIAWSFKAHVLTKLGFINDSISYCNYALNIDDMCEISWMSKAYFYNLLSNYEVCVSCCDAGLTINSQNEYLLNLKEYSLNKMSDGESL